MIILSSFIQAGSCSFLQKIKPVKKSLLIALILLISCQFLSAQTDTVKAAYLRFPTIPPFKLLKLDSSSFLTKEDLRKNRPLLLMYFSPECEHCKHQTEDILAAIKKFKNVQIVMATYQPFNEMKTFYEHYHLADHPNIKIGRDERFVLPPFYQIRNLPYIALYNKQGKLITTFEGNHKVQLLLDALKQKPKAQ
jgi:thioredoxin-related protein